MSNRLTDIEKRKLEEEKQKYKEQKLISVADALERVDPETKKMVWNIAKQMNDTEVVVMFNQVALDFFNYMINIAKKLGKEREYGFNGYLVFFQNALKININLPIDKFCLIILEFAPEIYAENEDCFMGMEIPDHNVNVGNEFSMIRSETFKRMWTILNDTDKKTCRDKTILLTIYAHAFLYKTLLLCQKQK